MEERRVPAVERRSGEMSEGKDGSLIDFKELTDYTENFTHIENDLLRKMEERARAIYIPIMNRSSIALVQQLIRWRRSTRILEIGTAIGYSAIRMRIAAGNTAKIVTIERDPEMIEEARNNIGRIGFEDSIRVVAGDAADELPEVHRAGPYDLILIDAAKVQYERLFLKYAEYLDPGGIIVTDNVLFHGLVCHPERVRKRSLHRLVDKVNRFNHFLASREDFETVFLTVGDGLAISTVRPDQGRGGNP